MDVRPIDANSLKNEILKLLNRFDTSESDFNNCYPYWIFSKTLQDTPTLDYAPVRHGRWVPVWKNLFSIAHFKCSVCGHREKKAGWAYCHCGAKMDGKEDGKDA